MKHQNVFNGCHKIVLIIGIVLSSQCFSMSILQLGTACLSSPAKLLVACAGQYPALTLVGLGVASYSLYNNEHTAPYVRPAVRQAVNLVGMGIEGGQRLLYVRPLENALSAMKQRINNLAHNVQKLVVDNVNMREQVKTARAQVLSMNESIVQNQYNVQQIAQDAGQKILSMGSALNGIAQAASYVGFTAQSACSLLASLSNKFQGRLDSTLLHSLHYGEDKSSSLSGAHAAANALLKFQV